MSGLEADISMVLGTFVVSVAFEAEPGETIAIVGPNGAGKSSTVRVLAGLERLDRGRISLAGRVLDEPATHTFVPPHLRHIGIAFQDALLFPHLSVRDNVAFGIDADRRSQRAEADGWLERVGLAQYGPRRVSELSGGEARRVAVARALVTGPDLVILDEPFAGLDVRARQLMQRVLVEQLSARDRTCVVITHDPADAHALADRIVAFEDGEISQIGTPTEIQSRPATKYLADLVGLNLLHGVASRGRVSVGGGLELAITNTEIAGDVVLTVPPGAVALHREQPSGSPRNTWQATVADLFARGDVVRVQFDAPVPIVADVTRGAVTDLGIAAGQPIWVAVKATSLAYREQ